MNALEALLQVRLNGTGVLGLRQDLQQLLVAEEEEARERHPLRFQVLAQALLNL